MGYFWFTLLLITFCAVGVVVFACRHRKEPELIDWLEWLQIKRKFILIPYAVVLLLLVWVLRSPLWATVGCQYDGYVREVETKYDWVKEICYFKTKSGAWMPLIMGRDSSEDKNHNQIPDTQEQN